MSFGVTAEGFVPPTVEELLGEVEDDQRSLITPDLDQSPDQPLGQLNGISTKKMVEVGEAIATAYNAFNRAAAEGALLDNIGSLTGSPRKEATKSKVTCTVNLDAVSTITAGSVINVENQPATRFVSVADLTSTTAGDYSLEFECEVTGPVVANAGTLTVIVTPAAGWNSVTNATDADLGTNVETDAEYRIRQVEELQAPGSCTVDAIRADLLQLAGIKDAFVFENTGMVTDGDGVPAKSFEAVIWDGVSEDADDDEVGQTIWDNKPSGIYSHGDTEVTVQDSSGNDRAVRFTRADQIEIYFEYTLTTDPNKFPIDGEDQVRAAVIAQGASVLTMGKDVLYAQFIGTPFQVAGVLNVELALGTSPSPSGTADITIGTREIATLDTSRITFA